ncbi:kinase-like domain-containing protein [Lactarius hatsudake]|nr:kinase-like domain-containing protein [Lactarius hatsudake]
MVRPIPQAGHLRSADSLVYSKFTLSSPHYPESFQVWVHLHSLPNNTFVLPHCAENGNGKRRLWLTHHIGFGSTGSVWECRFDNSDDLFATKVIELQRRSDVERQQRFYNEFEVYLSLEIAYQSGQLRDRITPHCYGAFEGDGTNVLILGLCGNTLNDWDELNLSELRQIYKLVRGLHRVGIIHGDLESRNIARVPGGGFRLIDFPESVRHTCVEISGKLDKPYKCAELQGCGSSFRDILGQCKDQSRSILGAIRRSTLWHANATADATKSLKSGRCQQLVHSGRL